MLKECFNNVENKTYFYLFMLVFEGKRPQSKCIIIYCGHRGSSYTHCPTECIEVSHKFTSRDFIQGLRNICMTVSKRQNTERR